MQLRVGPQPAKESGRAGGLREGKVDDQQKQQDGNSPQPAQKQTGSRTQQLEEKNQERIRRTRQTEEEGRRKNHSQIRKYPEGTKNAA